MAFSATADSSLTGLRFVAEVTPGVTPAAATFQEIEITQESLNNTRNTITSQSFRSDRQVPGTTIASESNGGDFGVELKYGVEQQTLIAAALHGSWANNAVSNGTERKSFTFEKEFGGVTGDGAFQLYPGSEISTWAGDMTVGAFITQTFGVIARDYSTSNATVANAVLPASTNPFMNSVDSGVVLKVDDVAAAEGVLQAFSWSLDNNMREQRAIGSAALAGVGSGRSNLTGGMTIYFNGGNNPIYAAYKAKTPIKLSIDIPDAEGNVLRLTFWKVDLLSATQVAGGLDQDVVVEMTWQAILSDVSGKTITVTRIPA